MEMGRKKHKFQNPLMELWSKKGALKSNYGIKIVKT